MRHYGLTTPLIALHEHNEGRKTQELIDKLLAGQSLALISDAGTPLISDPGYHLVKAARTAAIRVSPIPGPSALIAALSAAGLASDAFVFEGFLPNKQEARLKKLAKLADESRTLIFYEAPHRILACLEDMAHVFGADRKAVLARELTKNFESIHGDSLENLLHWIKADANQQKGEFVVLLEGKEKIQSDIDPEVLRVLDILSEELPLKQASSLAAKITGAKKNALYQIGINKKHDVT